MARAAAVYDMQNCSSQYITPSKAEFIPDPDNFFVSGENFL